MPTMTERMGHMKLVLAITALFALPALAGAATDGTCWDDGAQTWGVYNGTTGDDAGCVTPAEYSAMFSPPGLLEAGVISDWWMVSDTEAVIVYADTGIQVVVEFEPMDRPLAATPVLEPEAPAISVWWDTILAQRSFLRSER